MSALAPLAPQARWLFHLRALSRLFGVWTPGCVVFSVALASKTSWTTGAAVGAALWLAAFVWAVWMPSLTFDRWGYRLTDVDLRVESGVIVRNFSAIPLHRVQFVDIRQGFLDQLFGLATLRVHTASGLGADAAIPGLALEDAERLRGELVARARGDDGV